MKIKLNTMSKWDLPCMNSNSLFTTVFKNFQCALRNLGYWPTMYMIFDAIIALLSLPLFCSHNPKRSCKIRQIHLWLHTVKIRRVIPLDPSAAYLNNSNKKPLLVFFMHRTTNGAYGPTQGIQILPWPFCTIHLILKFLSHYYFCIYIIQMCKINYKEKKSKCLT